MRLAAPSAGHRALRMVALVALAALTLPAPALAALTASVADLSLAAVPYSHADQATSGSLTLTAEDTGTCVVLLGCSNDGWNVTVLASDFAYSGPNNGSPIPAANLVITTAHAPTHVSGDPINPTGGPRTTNVTGALNVSRKTLQADGPSGTLVTTYYGIGRYQQAIDVALTVPGRSRAGTYTTTLTVTMAAGP